MPPDIPLEPSQRPPLIGATDGSSLDSGKKRGGFISRAAYLLAAFIAGGLLTTGGFYLGQRNQEPVASGSVISVATTAAPVTSGTTVAPVPTEEIDPEIEPAAFVADVLGPSAVQIRTNLGTGSGVIIESDLIITNHHVVEGARTIEIVLDDGRTIQGDIVGSDQRTDIAVVRVGAGLDLQVATLALGEELDVGQTAIAIGAPFDLNKSVTAGIISAINRPIDNGIGINAMIQTDAPINPGNSGGALADRFGRVIGINTAIQTGGVSNSNAGVGFAVPIDTAMNVAQRIIDGRPLDKGFLGVRAGTEATGEIGVILGEITPESGAEQAGLLPGDRVVRINGAPVTDFRELAGLISGGFPGDEVELDIVRGSQALSLTAVLGE